MACENRKAKKKGQISKDSTRTSEDHVFVGPH